MLSCSNLYCSFQLMYKHQGSIVKLVSNKIMEYDWGSTSKQCIIADLTHKQCKKYAQLWMGTHKNGPSLLSGNQTLSQYLSQMHAPDLPFLFKVLCIEKALSIQLHPNKQQAQRLFKQKPEIYQDDNEKPEMFLTLTEFQCFFGIISDQQLTALCDKYPFSLLATRHSGSIKKIIAEMIQLPEEAQKYMIDRLLKNAESIVPQRKDILLRLQEQFPYDIGILVSCLLKYKKIPPGQCYAIEAGVPHAYLKGSCMQIMKNSDNVVRLGLTPKLKDTHTMLQIMNQKLGLDGIKVQNGSFGYIWNDLIIRQVFNKKHQVCEVSIPYFTIGIVFQGEFIVSTIQVKAKKGEVLFFSEGEYVLQGQFRMILGSYAAK